MAVRKENLLSNSSQKHSQPIELFTENGFSIFRRWEVDGVAPVAGAYNFLVRNPHAEELEITVRISPDAVTDVLKRSEGRVSGNSPFWISCAERHLASYLWENDDYPPNTSLDVDRLTPDDLDLARRWKINRDFS